MHSLLAALVLAAAAATVSVEAAIPFQCRFGVLPRKEFRTLSTTERTSFFAAYKKVMARTSSGTPSFYDQLVKAHIDYKDSAHGYAGFFPWHRYFLATLEQELQKQHGGPLTLPYWNTHYDGAAPELAPVWGDSDLHFGRNGGNNGCVRTGAFANRQAIYPSQHCLQREWASTSSMDSFVAEDVIRGYISGIRNYDQFRETIELDPHGGVHVSIGGDMSQMHSPNDPIFFLHHANVDRIWWNWQRANPSLARTYNGRAYDFRTRRPRTASAKDTLTPYSVTVEEVFDTAPLCYTYAEVDLSRFVPQLPEPRVRQFGLDQRDAEAIFGEDTPDASRAPVDPLVRVAPLVEGASVKAPTSMDRRDLTKLRVPKPLPESWIQMTGIPVERVQEHERELKRTIDELNAQPDFVSETALIKRPDFLVELVQASKAEPFKAILDGVQVSVKKEAGAEPAQATANLVERVAKVAEMLGTGLDLKQ